MDERANQRTRNAEGTGREEPARTEERTTVELIKNGDNRNEVGETKQDD